MASTRNPPIDPAARLDLNLLRALVAICDAGADAGRLRTTSGLWASDDGGDCWSALPALLEPISSGAVRPTQDRTIAGRTATL
jgi:hypothetical protein